MSRTIVDPDAASKKFILNDARKLNLCSFTKEKLFGIKSELSGIPIFSWCQWWFHSLKLNLVGRGGSLENRDLFYSHVSQIVFW